MVLLFAVVIALHLWSLMRFPMPFVDEAWFASRAWGFVQTGRAFGPLDAGVFDRFEGYWTLFPWLPTVIQSLSLRLSAAPELFPMRALSLFFGVLLLGVVYSIANRLGGWKVGLFSVGLTSLSWPFFFSAHLARIDIIAAALGFIAVALYLNDRSPRWWMGLLSGLCIGLAFEVHPHSAIYAPALVALHFLRWRWKMFRQGHFWGFMGGGVVGVVFYAALHILPYPQSYAAFSRLAFGPTHLPPLIAFDISVLAQAVYDTGLLLLVNYHFFLPVVIWAVVIMMRRRTESDKVLLVLCAALVISTILLMRNKLMYYAILFSPAIDMTVVIYLLWLFQRQWQGRLQDYVGRGLALGLCIGAVGMNLSLLSADNEQVFASAQACVDETVEPGDVIMGPQTFWFGLYNHVYYSQEELIYYQRYVPGSTLEDALREFQPDVFIIIGRGMFSEWPGDSPYAQHLWLSLPEFEAFVDRQAYLANECWGDYGRVRVYRIMWE